jgi:hypothetical protein
MATSLKEDVIDILNHLPQERLTEVLDFALFVQSRAQGSVSQHVVQENANGQQGASSYSVDVVEDVERLFYGRH